jgi:hypothetical protein
MSSPGRVRATVLVAVVVGIFVSLSTSAASAADRYASPTGTGSLCTAAAPCSLHDAYDNNPNFAFPVIVLPGVYGSAAAPLLNLGSTGIAAGLSRTITGAIGASRPTIYVSTVNPGAGSIAFFNSYGTTSDLNIVVVASPTTQIGANVSGGTVNRLAVSGNAPYACTGDQSMANVICTTNALYGTAILSQAGGSSTPGDPPFTRNFTYRNVIGWTSEAGVAGLENVSNYSVITNITAINSIFHSGNQDIHATTNAFNGAEAHVSLDHSNYTSAGAPDANSSVTPPGAGTNQTAPPIFANAAGADFHAMPGSPTIDAGADDAANGAFDLDGTARTQGARTDIGAYESIPTISDIPPVAEPPAAPVAPIISPAKLKAKQFKSSTTLAFSVSGAASIKLTLAKSTTGRKVGGKCSRKTKSNSKAKSCVLLSPVKGTATLDAAAGANTFKLAARWKGKKLAAGVYTLTMLPSAGALSGKAVSVRFAIIK